MEARYGWLLPAGAAGQGRGSRSFAHAAKSSALVHDASYLCPLLLHGTWPFVHAALAPLLPPGQAAALAEAWAEAASSGGPGCSGWEQGVWLHHPGRYPRGAICPAQPTRCITHIHPRLVAPMAAALQGSSSSGSGAGAGSGASPSGSGLLQWRPKQEQQLAGAPGPAAAAGAADGSGATPASSLCLLESAVFPLKTGAPAEGAAICVVAGWEVGHSRQPLQVLTARQQRRRQRQLEEQRAALAEAAAEVGEQDVQPIGFVLAEAPRGAPRRCGALAAVGAAAVWRLRSLQHWEPARHCGGIRAYLRNPGSAALFPVRLQLAVETAGATP
ncbi:ribonucleases P MRP subunit POP1 [Micractinium conductrix]|uniref:Ribonucleases P MRP subunit POP1 n=1 Tax=Micractinium conductrix TaxID=554055 RepID=A0A2P6V143_9CHLO|nr:ribonucleases P MRP subunit POP1 [Micractinium conductrix]|eukprot:PSC67809.1 ribonucleases P MRP subunit POP1 [Micractinium conductrix]